MLGAAQARTQLRTTHTHTHKTKVNKKEQIFNVHQPMSQRKLGLEQQDPDIVGSFKALGAASQLFVFCISLKQMLDILQF